MMAVLGLRCRRGLLHCAAARLVLMHGRIGHFSWEPPSLVRKEEEGILLIV